LFILWFLIHNFLVTTNARKPIEGSKDADFQLVFFIKKEAQSSLLRLRLRARWSGPKRPKPTPIMRSRTAWCCRFGDGTFRQWWSQMFYAKQCVFL